MTAEADSSCPVPWLLVIKTTRKQATSLSTYTYRSLPSKAWLSGLEAVYLSQTPAAIDQALPPKEPLLPSSAW